VRSAAFSARAQTTFGDQIWRSLRFVPYVSAQTGRQRDVGAFFLGLV
jgi:hypothetical protein